MTCIKAIKNTFVRSFLYVRPITFLWGITFLFGYLLLHPYIREVGKFFSTSGINDLFMNKNFSMIQGDFNFFHSSANTMLIAAIFFGLLLYIFFSIATNGGLIAQIFKQEKGSINQMLADGFKNYKYLLFIWLINLLVSGIILFVGGIIMAIVIGVGDFSNEVPIIHWLIVTAVLVFLLWIVKDFVVDYLKMFYFKRLNNGPGIHLAGAIQFVFGRLFRLMIFAFLMLILLIAIMFIGHLLGNLFNQFDMRIIIALIISQFIVWLRIWWRVWFWAGEREFITE